MKFLVTGARGMLGRDLCELLAARYPAVAFGRAEADVTDLDALLSAFRRERPDVVIHAAAATNVDGCEEDPAWAYRVNAWGAWATATAAEDVGARFVLVSTDFVFDGKSGRAYSEFDQPNPINVYGASKLAGEQASRQACRRVAVARTQWLYGRHGPSFPRTILRAAAGGGPLRVVTDQVGTPTYTRHLAAKLLWLCEQPCNGTYHLSNAGAVSRYDWAREILRLVGWEDVELLPWSSAEWPTPARRPASSVLRRHALELRGADDMPSWQEGLAAFIEELGTAGEIPLRG